MDIDHVARKLYFFDDYTPTYQLHSANLDGSNGMLFGSCFLLPSISRPFVCVCVCDWSCLQFFSFLFLFFVFLFSSSPCVVTVTTIYDTQVASGASQPPFHTVTVDQNPAPNGMVYMLNMASQMISISKSGQQVTMLQYAPFR